MAYGRGIVFPGSVRQLAAGEEGGDFGMDGGVEGEDVEGAGAEGMVGGGIREEAVSRGIRTGGRWWPRCNGVGRCLAYLGRLIPGRCRAWRRGRMRN